MQALVTRTAFVVPLTVTSYLLTIFLVVLRRVSRIALLRTYMLPVVSDRVAWSVNLPHFWTYQLTKLFSFGELRP